PVDEYFALDIRIAIAYGILFATPLLPWMTGLAHKTRERIRALAPAYDLCQITGLVVIFLFSAMALAAGTHNPFIYFRF
ncbi:MAG TPA: hypothetical protein VLL07_04665, partial [Pontiella sp.]|nr:hypothetical protein [Pontiella sp.]